MLYGTTPPRLGTSAEEITQAAEKLAARIESINPDSLIVYNVQDESERTSEPRPFPFLPTIDSRVYSQILHELSGKPIITYKAVGNVPENEWERWLTESAQDFGVSTLSLVGRPSRKQVTAPSQQPLSLAKATELAKSHSAGFDLGAVAIAERHSAANCESLRMIEKGQRGCDFFISQSVYDSQKTISLLNDYARECRSRGLAPKRFVFTFAPCGHAKTLDFIKWLGVSVPPAVERGILEAADPLGASIEVCRMVFREILDGLEDKSLPLGVNVESVSIRKVEIDASLELFRVLEREFKSGG